MNLKQFRKDLENSRIEPGVLSACLAVTDLLVGLRKGDGAHLGLAYFNERLGKKADRERLLPALSILCTRQDAPLEMNGYLDDAEYGQLHLSDEDFAYLMTSGKLAHPLSGELVAEPFTRVRIFYSLRHAGCRAD